MRFVAGPTAKEQYSTSSLPTDLRGQDIQQRTDKSDWLRAATAASGETNRQRPLSDGYLDIVKSATPVRRLHVQSSAEPLDLICCLNENVNP
jgi:hypothetical protein